MVALRWLLVSFAVGAGCSDRPLPLPPGPRYFDVETAAAACLTEVGCAGPLATKVDFTPIGLCIETLTRLAPTSYGLDTMQVGCLAAARGDCARALRCFTRGGEPTACSDPAPVGCVGDLKRVCSVSDGYYRETDCAALGLRCLGGTCVSDVCAPDEKAVAHCRGARIVKCTAPQASPGGPARVLGDDCGDVNAVCSDTANGPSCVGKGPACSGGTVATFLPRVGLERCDGELLVSCVHGREAGFDCTSLGLDCLHDPHGGYRCGAGLDCDADLFVPSCAGGVITFCRAGVIATRPWSC